MTSCWKIKTSESLVQCFLTVHSYKMPWESGCSISIQEGSLEVKVKAQGMLATVYLFFYVQCPKCSTVHLLFQMQGDNELLFSLWPGQSWPLSDQVGTQAKGGSFHSNLPHLLCTYLSWKTQWPNCQMPSALILELKNVQEWDIKRWQSNSALFNAFYIPFIQLSVLLYLNISS